LNLVVFQDKKFVLQYYLDITKYYTHGSHVFHQKGVSILLCGLETWHCGDLLISLSLFELCD